MIKQHFSCLFFCLIALFMLSCGDEETLNIDSADERKKSASDSIINELIAPQFGWKVNYQPSPQSGTFLILMSFDNAGNLNIKSDIVAGEETFFNTDITYRIDNGIGTELIFETYSVFHLLQEQLGGEFEFLYLQKIDGNLIFQSKTDVGNPTILTFEPAGEFDENLLSGEITNNLRKVTIQDPGLVGSNIYFQLYLVDKDISVFMTLDLDARSVKVLNAGVGRSMIEIISNDQTVEIGHVTNYSTLGENINFDTGASFSLNGESILISEFQIANAQESLESYCSGQDVTKISFEGTIGNESIIFSSSLFSASTTFVPISDNPYSGNTFNLIDGTDESLESLILEAFPDLAVLQFYFNYTQIDPALNGFGFVTVDSNDNAEFYLREFTTPTVEGNRLTTTLGEALFTAEPTDAQRQVLFELTDQLFSGGELFVLEIASIDDFYELYNPCNKYKLFLLK
ncbi:MAG: hypothetical protein ACJATI_002563 [Halioglobus sp.]|jgi:hypothetical protein